MKIKSKPLVLDPKRQATDAIGGYVYQIWQSLYAWIHLKDDEALFLEGAEDIDVVSLIKSTTTQVKRLSRNITLNSPEVIEAISNYWKLKQKETRSVMFHFLTTAQRGKERNSPFNESKGLDYWDNCKTGDDVTLLKQFLLTTSNFSKELKEFIKLSSKGDFLNKLVMPIHWLTEEGNLESLRKKVEDDLILHGEKNGFSANDSKKAAINLIDMLWTIVCRKEVNNRVIGRADFLTAFESSLTESVSKSELKIMRDLMTQLTGTLLNQQNGILPTSSGSNKINTAIFKPHIVDKSTFIFRKVLVEDMHLRMQTLNFILIRGSSGMGKSVLSLQVVETNRNEWERVNFRGLKGENINEMLNGLYEYYTPKACNILLDDINFGDDYQIYTDSFERLVNLVVSNKKKVIVTSQKQLPQQLTSKLNLATESDFTVPKFSTNEIISLLLLNSCPNTDINLWIKDIEFTTRSHPQLVHARIRRLKEEGWDKSKIILKTEELVEVKHEVVGKLISELPSPEARNLLLRLSILTGSFKRKNALVLAKYPSEIATPGVIFNQLIGPYVEQDTQDSYRLSPLLDNAFQDNFSQDEIKVLHQLAGESYLSKTLSPNDLFNIFFHGIMSGSGRIMFFAFAAFQSIGNKYKKLIYPHLELLMYIHIGTGKLAFENDEVLNLMFRHIQFTLAVETGNIKSAIAIADVWFSEVKVFKNKGPFQKEPQAKMFPFMFFLSVFKDTSLEIPMEKCIEWIIGAYDFIRKNPEINSTFKQSFQDQSSSWKELIPEVALTKRINSSNIEQFMISIASLPGGLELLTAINNNDILPQRVVDNVWLDQIDKKGSDWTWTLDVLAKLKEFSIERKAFNITAFAIRAIAIIKNEYTQDQKGAKEELTKGIKEIGKHPELIDYEAKIAFIDNNYVLALQIWESVLPDLEKRNNLTASFAYRNAAVSAGNLGKWDIAAKYFKLATDHTKKQNSRLYEVQCLADYGFALWKLKKYSECIKVFVDVIDAFPQLPNPKTNLRALGLLKMTSNTLIYFKKTLNPYYRSIGIPYTEPFAGSHSQTEFSEKLKELPIPPSISLWVFLAVIEHELNLGSTAFSKLISVYKDLPILFQADAKKVEIVKSLKTGDLSSIVENMIDFFALTTLSVESENRHELIKELTPEDIEHSLTLHGATILNMLASDLRVIAEGFPLPSKGYGFNNFYAAIEIKLRRVGGESNTVWLDKLKKDANTLLLLRREVINAYEPLLILIALDKKANIGELVEQANLGVEVVYQSK